MEPNKRNRIVLTVSTTIGLILTIIGVMQLTKTTHFLLPISSFFPTIAILLPSVTLFLLIIPVASPSVFATRRLFYPTALILLIVFSTILLGLLSPYVSPNLSHCIHETLWNTLFREKSLKIERIENALRCCGFNTPYDRAYPFNVGANACVLQYKYTDSCADMWQHETKIVAEWCIVVFSVLLLCGVGGLLHTILVYKRQSAQIPRDPPRSSHSSYNAVAVKAIERGAQSERSGLLEQPAHVNPSASSLLDLEAH
ncbi:hypothetical protein V1520DRAFT_332308 [Lipomyces starkeyi]|uniref:Tetraspanin n=1 Tax=Lipomyces starkeyi NRRL Y-11557 TaxID=675824 RepID=A0A1E3QAK1_LIPST|nr:hypothetical protein LIPSTDRAFT_70183 [Lipomyces starkeyi NRRL Y-11557]